MSNPDRPNILGKLATPISDILLQRLPGISDHSERGYFAAAQELLWSSSATLALCGDKSRIGAEDVKASDYYRMFMEHFESRNTKYGSLRIIRRSQEKMPCHHDSDCQRLIILGQSADTGETEDFLQNDDLGFVVFATPQTRTALVHWMEMEKSEGRKIMHWVATSDPVVTVPLVELWIYLASEVPGTRLRLGTNSTPNPVELPDDLIPLVRSRFLVFPRHELTFTQS